MYPLFVEDGEIVDNEKKRVATFSEISSPQQLEQLQPIDDQAENLVINLVDWQVFTLYALRVLTNGIFFLIKKMEFA